MEVVGVSDSQTLVHGLAAAREPFQSLQACYISVSRLRPRHQVMLGPSQIWEPLEQMVFWMSLGFMNL